MTESFFNGKNFKSPKKVMESFFDIKNLNTVMVSRGGSRTAATSKMERFVMIISGFQPLTIIRNAPSWTLQQS